MVRFSVRRVATLACIVAMVATVEVSSQESSTTRRAVGPDPAVTAFTTFVVGKQLAFPAPRPLVVAALDRLASAIEGLALPRNVLADVDFERIHQLRRDIRALGISADTSALTKPRAGTSVTTAQLLRTLDGAVPPGGPLTLEFAARHPRRYAAVVAFSGDLIGPPGTSRDYEGSFDGTPVFIGCSDVDAPIPVERVRESSAVFRRRGAVVDERIHPRLGHTVNRDELDAVERLLTG